jgi:hypothetical protein
VFIQSGESGRLPDGTLKNTFIEMVPHGFPVCGFTERWLAGKTYCLRAPV